MGFSVYGRIGGQNGNNVQNNYSQNTYYPKVSVTKSYLNSGRSSGVSYGGAQPYNPKSRTFQKKDNKALKTALLIAGVAAGVYLGRGKIEAGLTAVKKGLKKVFGPMLQKLSKVTLGDIWNAPGAILRKGAK